MRSQQAQRLYNVEYYRRNRDIEYERIRVRQAGMIELLHEVRNVPCAHCGGQFAPYQLEFDHRDPSTKSFNVMSSHAMLMSTQRVLDEVAKCDIVCVNCHRIRSREQHRMRLLQRAPGTSRRIEQQRAMWRRQAQMLDQMRAVPCADCGNRFPPCSMDFDHQDPAEKNSNVPAMIGRAGDARILAEAAKCDIVCANCHRRRTYERRMMRE